MRLRNKKTGVVGEVGYISTSTGDILVSNIHDQEEWYHYKSLAALNAEWGDIPEEPKNGWYLDSLGKPIKKVFGDDDFIQTLEAIGNYFETKEEAEKAAEKLKAWKRLKSCGFKFKGWRTADLGADKYYFVIRAEADNADPADVDLLFPEEK